jgi:hypothetical protein
LFSSKIATALAGGFADSKPLQIVAPEMASGSFTPVKWRVKTLLKDLNMATDLASTQSGKHFSNNQHIATNDHLIANFGHLPLPTAPICVSWLYKGAKTSRAICTDFLLPPAIMASVPFVAPATPPETGASTQSILQFCCNN